jgi:hypothetical protein
MGETSTIVKTKEFLSHLKTADFGNVFLSHPRGCRLPKMDNPAIANLRTITFTDQTKQLCLLLWQILRGEVLGCTFSCVLVLLNGTWILSV